MKKFTVIGIIVATTFMFTSVVAAKPKTSPSAPAAIVIGDTITGCYKKVNGQLRIVSNPSQCNPSEAAVSWGIVGPQGPAGVVSTDTISGDAGVVSSASSAWVFVGPTVKVTLAASQRITGAAQAPLGILTAGVASFGYDLCYKTAGSADPLTNFTAGNASIGEVSDTAGRPSFTAAASATPGEATGMWDTVSSIPAP